MINETQFTIIENYFGKELESRLDISIQSTEYVKMDSVEKELFPELDDEYGVISFMNEGNENFIKEIYILVAEFATQYERVHTKMESHQSDYGDFVTVCFLDIF